MEKLSFHVAEFEGPLDLLLHLIVKHKLDIRDIRISQLLEQYMDYIHQLEHANLEVASEFLEMASRLVYIKTAMLLPRHEQEGEQLKAELQGQLLEYQVCKQVAQTLRERCRLHLSFTRPPERLQADLRYRLTHPPEQLFSAYLDAVGRGKRRLPPPAKAFQAIVERRVVSVGSRIIHLLKTLYRNNQTSYLGLFDSSTDRSELVATFLAVLELVKAKRITVEGDQVQFDRTRRDAVPAKEEWSYD